MLRLFCTHNHYDVIEAANGQEALEIINENCPDLVILDILMPGIDGFDTVLQIRENTDCNRLPILFFSAKSDVEAVQKGMAAGAQGFLSKPTSLTMLLQHIKDLLGDAPS